MRLVRMGWMCLLCMSVLLACSDPPAKNEKVSEKSSEPVVEKSVEPAPEPVVDAGPEVAPEPEPDESKDPPPIADGVKVRIVHVTDGDTVYALTRIGGWASRIRLLGFNAPECTKKKSGSFSVCNGDIEYFGVEAYKALQAIYTKYRGKQFLLTCVNKGDECEKDVFDRYLAYLQTPDGEDVGELLMKQGMGWAFTKFESTKRADYCKAEANAIRNKVGMWKQGGRTFVKGKMSSDTRNWYYSSKAGKSHDALCSQALGSSFQDLAGE